MNAYQVLKDLKDGNKRRFLAGTSEFSSDINLQKLKTYAEGGQSPKAIILCCSDSRAPVEMIFDQHLGDLFVIRVAGNIVAPSLIGSVEFATAKFGTNLVIVMGHTQCGAINATIEHLESIENVVTENILDIIGRIKPRIQHIVRLKESRKKRTSKPQLKTRRLQ